MEMFTCKLNVRSTSRIESSSPRISILHTKNLDVERDGLVVDMNHFDTGMDSIKILRNIVGNLLYFELNAPAMPDLI